MAASDNFAMLLRVGALGYVVGFFSWFYYASHLLPFLVGVRIGFPTEYMRILPAVIYFLLGVSHFFGSLGCLALFLRYNSRSAILCFVFYVATGTAWFYSILTYRSWPMLGYTFMIGAQLVWGITLMTNQKNFLTPQVCNTVGIVFTLLAILSTVYWPVIGYFGFPAWLAGLGWLYAIGAAASAILIVKLSRAR